MRRTPTKSRPARPCAVLTSHFPPVCSADSEVHLRCAGLARVPEGDWLCDVCTNKSKSKKRLRIVPKVISYSSDACYKGWWLQEEIDSNDYLFWGSGDHATPADVQLGRWRKYDQLRRGVRVVAGPGDGCTLRVNDEPPVVFERTSEMHHRLSLIHI